MSALEIGTTMVEMVNSGREGEQAFVDQYYADDILSIEGGGSDEMPTHFEGIEAVRLAWAAPPGSPAKSVCQPPRP